MEHAFYFQTATYILQFPPIAHISLRKIIREKSVHIRTTFDICLLWLSKLKPKANNFFLFLKVRLKLSYLRDLRDLRPNKFKLTTNLEDPL